MNRFFKTKVFNPIKRGLPGIFFALCIAPMLISAVAWAQAPCDASLTPETNPSIQYRQRADDLRCEGFYRAEVSTIGSLDVVGLLLRPLRYGTGNEVLSIRAVPKNQRVLVRGQGIPVKLYYRLDAELAPGGTLRWPTDLLQRQGIDSQQVGLYGRLVERTDWYVPLDVGGKQPPPVRPRLLLRAAVDTEEVLWRYAEVAGERCGAMTDWQKLATPLGFAGGEAILIELHQVKHRRLCLEVAARTRREGEWLKRLVRIQR